MAQSNSKLVAGGGVPEKMICSEGTKGVQNSSLDQEDSCEENRHMRERACHKILKGKRIQKLSKDWNLGTAGVKDFGRLS